MPGRAHAEHNEQLCDLLLKDTHYDDWVITTAFYSAIHLVDHQIFPLTVAPQPAFGSFIQYLKRVRPNIAPHDAREELVSQQLPKCHGAFRWLMDECKNARYNNYQVSPDFAKRARGCLDSIKKSCPKT
jgi:hypothetical protein